MVVQLTGRRGAARGAGVNLTPLFSPVKDWPGDATVAFSPDGKWLGLGKSAEYQLWKVGTWELSLRIPRGQPGGSGPLAFSPDGKMLAIVRAARHVRLVDPITGSEFATLPPPNPQPISWLCFSRDCGQLAVGAGNQTIHLWDLSRIRRELAKRNLSW
jgi:WD40 repeat protein